jgi:hypothetical protein
MSHLLCSLILIPPYVCENTLLESILVAYTDNVTACSLLPMNLFVLFRYLWASCAVSGLCLFIKLYILLNAFYVQIFALEDLNAFNFWRIRNE